MIIHEKIAIAAATRTYKMYSYQKFEFFCLQFWQKGRTERLIIESVLFHKDYWQIKLKEFYQTLVLLKITSWKLPFFNCY